MYGLDPRVADLGDGGLVIALLLAFLVGLRHATDPDHLTAIATLVMSERCGARRAGALGLGWGVGHGLSVLAVGLPVALAGGALPAGFQLAAELAVAVLILGLAGRLLLRWRRGYFHFHPHDHGPVRHAHPHFHDRGRGERHPVGHDHAAPAALGRSPIAALGIGLVHGVGGSAMAGVLLAGAAPGSAAALAVGVFALATAVAMGALSALAGAALRRAWLTPRAALTVPAFGAASVAFGLWYGLAALETVPYAF